MNTTKSDIQRNRLSPIQRTWVFALVVLAVFHVAMFVICLIALRRVGDSWVALDPVGGKPRTFTLAHASVTFSLDWPRLKVNVNDDNSTATFSLNPWQLFSFRSNIVKEYNSTEETAQQLLQKMRAENEPEE